MRLGAWEIILIIVLVLIVFGGSKLAGVGKSLGRSIKEFKEEVNTPDKKDDPPKDTSEEPAEIQRILRNNQKTKVLKNESKGTNKNQEIRWCL